MGRVYRYDGTLSTVEITGYTGVISVRPAQGCGLPNLSQFEGGHRQYKRERKHSDHLISVMIRLGISEANTATRFAWRRVL